MNFLAHLYLSGKSDELRIGNFIGDAVKGNMVAEFPSVIQHGIRLHRAIDSYTDTHPKVLESARRLYPYYHKYAGVIVDIYYDHFLAKYWHEFSDVELSAFAEEIYGLMTQNTHALPLRSKQMLPYMIKHNWLESYAQLEGVNRVLHGMSTRTKFNSGMETAGRELEEFYASFEEEFRSFFPDVIKHSEEFIRQLS